MHWGGGRLSLLSSISYTNELAALKCQSVRNCGILVVIGGSLYIQPIWKHSLFTTVFSLRDVLQRKRLYSSADKTFVLGTNFGPYRNSWYKKSYSDTSRILSAIAESEVIVGTRFHASILGLAAGCKVLPIIYSDKTSHSLDDIGFASDIRLDLRNFKSDDISICRKVLARERVDIGEVKTQSQRHFIGLDCVLGVGR